MGSHENPKSLFRPADQPEPWGNRARSIAGDGTGYGQLGIYPKGTQKADQYRHRLRPFATR